MAFKLKDGFSGGDAIPKRSTCDGDDVSPRLHWTGEPADTQGLALIMNDPDAPGHTWNHWLLSDIPADVHSLPEGRDSVAKSGKNDFGGSGYGGLILHRREAAPLLLQAVCA